jgi:hypothetical protein
MTIDETLAQIRELEKSNNESSYASAANWYRDIGMETEARKGWTRIASNRASHIGTFQIGTSAAYDAAQAYESAGKPLHAAKFHMLSGYGLPANFTNKYDVSDDHLSIAAQSAAKHARNANARWKGRGLINGSLPIMEANSFMTQADMDERILYVEHFAERIEQVYGKR